MHQINTILARRQDITPELAAQAKRKVLDRLMDQQVAQAVARQMAQYKGQSIIEYFGEFAKAGPTSPAAVPAGGGGGAEPAPPEKRPGPDLAKGVRGLR